MQLPPTPGAGATVTRVVALQMPAAAVPPPGAPRAKGRMPGRGRQWRFSLPELLIVMVVIIILATLMMPVLGRTMGVARNVVCVGNMRQLVMAWCNYQVDNGGHFVNSMVEPGGWAGPGQDPQSITDYVLYPYVGDARVYRCPADPWPHVRTYSINTYLNGSECLWYYECAPATQGTQLKRPASTFVFIEEFDARGFNTNAFVAHCFTMDPYYWWGATPRPWVWIDTPATWHFRNGCNLTFADGRVEGWTWRDERTMTLDGWPFQNQQIGNADLTRLIQHIGKP